MGESFSFPTPLPIAGGFSLFNFSHYGECAEHLVVVSVAVPRLPETLSASSTEQAFWFPLL